MERHDVLAMMTALKLAGMRAAYDDILADGLKRRHPVQQIIGTLLQTEVADKQARSIKYQMTSARLPTAKELADFDFAASPVNEPLIQEGCESRMAVMSAAWFVEFRQRLPWLLHVD